MKIFREMPINEEEDGAGDDDEDGELSEDSRAILEELEDSKDVSLEILKTEGFTTATVGSQSALYKRFGRCQDIRNIQSRNPKISFSFDKQLAKMLHEVVCSVTRSRFPPFPRPRIWNLQRSTGSLCPHGASNVELH